MEAIFVDDHKPCPFRYLDDAQVAYCTLGPWFCRSDSVPEWCPLREGQITVIFSRED